MMICELNNNCQKSRYGIHFNLRGIFTKTVIKISNNIVLYYINMIYIVVVLAVNYDEIHHCYENKNTVN